MLSDDEYYALQRDGSAWTGQSPQYAQRVKDAIDTLGDLTGLVVADVGCGDGTSTAHIKSKGAKTVIGMEYSKEKVEYANRKVQLTRTEPPFYVAWFDLDNYSLPGDPPSEAAESYDEFFDIVFCSHTLEHTRDAIKSTKNLCRMVKPGGKLVIIVPKEEVFPVNNPSHTQWMNSERLGRVFDVINKELGILPSVEFKFRLEKECWITATRPKC